MFQGELLAIYTTSTKNAEPSAVAQAEVVVGRGLVGDRYCRNEGAGRPDQEVTLIESEAIEAVTRDADLTLTAAQARRNLLTRGVPLNHLVNRTFRIGDVTLRGLRLCEPCGHLEKMTCAGVQKHLAHRGGLRAEVVAGGVIRPGDAIRPAQ